jgi:hypothetical protein
MLDMRRQFSLPGDELQGDWSRAQLLEMDGRFTAAVEAALASGLESRTAASATIQVGRRRVKEEAIEAAVEGAWLWFWQKDADVSFADVVSFARARCANVDPACVRAGFEKRRRERRTPAGSA